MGQDARTKKQTAKRDKLWPRQAKCSKACDHMAQRTCNPRELGCQKDRSKALPQSSNAKNGRRDESRTTQSVQLRTLGEQ
jgi:hypothetical protein